MKVLEAIQLILSVPGAPVIAFLAIDSRIVVASIEQSKRRGHECVYLGLGVSGQNRPIPFSCAPPRQLKRLVKAAWMRKSQTLLNLAAASANPARSESGCPVQKMPLTFQ